MSTIDERVVILEFNNSQFESGVQQSVSTLQKLKSALNLDDSANSLNKLSSAGKSFSLTHVADNVQTVADRFSMLGIVGDQVLRRLTDSALKLGKNLITAVPNQIISGGKRRSQNLEHAKFMLEGILQDAYDWKKINDDLDYAVGGTRFGLDEAASAAGQLAASSVQFGDDMKAALRGISGVATMTNDEYSTISQIFTKIAGQGKVTAQELNQFAAHGINVAATMAKEFDTTEEEIRALVHEGQVGFLDFAYAMDSAFGEHAKRANDTFTGALANVKAALSRMGEQFATPVYDNLRLILVALIPVLNDIKAFTEPIAAGFKGMAEAISGFVVPALEGLHVKFAEMRGLVTDYGDFETVFTKWADALTGKTPEEIEQLGLLNQAFEELDQTYTNYKDTLKGAFDKTIATNDMEMAMNVLAGVVESTEAGVKVTFDEILAGMNDSGEAAKKTVRDVFTELLNVKTNSKGILDDIKKTTESLDKDTEKIKDTYKSSTKESKKFTSWQSLVFDSTKAAYKGLKEYGVEGLALNKAMRQEAETAAKQKADKERVKDLKTINANEKSYVKTLARETEQSKKQSAIEKFKNGVFQKASGLVSGIAKGAADIFGFNQETVAVLADQKDYLQVVDDLAQKGIHGEFGNGEDRVKALEDLGAAYSIVQNRINEVLGCEVRHTETAEDEAKMMEYVCKTLGITTEQGKNITTVLDNLTGIFEGLISLFGIIREVALGLFNEIIKPFLGVIGPALLALITTPFAKIGNVLVDFWAKIAPKEDGSGGLGEYFANLREKIVAFWESAKELEGVKKLQEAWGNFKKTIKGLWDTGLSKVQTGFAELKKNFKLPEGQFFLDLINNISTKLADFWTWMSGKATVVSDFFSPMFDWLVGLPVKVQDFWNSIGGFKGVQSYFKPITDWFAGIGDSIGNFWSSLWGKKGEEGAEDVPGLFSPIVDWFDKLKQKFDAFIQEASKFTNIKDLFDWLVELVRGKVKNFWDTLWGVNEAGEGEEAVDGNLSLFERLKKAIDDFLGELNPLKALQDFFTNFWTTLFGGGEDKENGEPKKGVFAQFKEDALAFIDSVEPLKTVKDYVLSIFNEDLITSIQDVGAAIKEFFTNLFGAQEEGKEKLPFVDRFMQAAEGLKTKLAEIFGGKGAGLAKILAGGKIVTTLLALAGILTKLNKNQNGEGIAGAVFGSSRSGFSLPGIVSIITAAAAALLLFGDNSEKAGEKSKTAGDILTNVWTTIQNLFGNITSWFSSVDPLGFIFGALFGTKDGNGETQTKGIVTYLEEKITTIFDSVSKFFTDFINEDKFGIGNALVLLGGGALGFGLFNIFKGIASLFTTLFGIIKGGIPLLGDISNALEAYTTNVRADTLLTIAHAIGVFALSLIGLSLIPTDRLNGVVGAVIVLMGVIALLMGLYAKFFTKGSTVKELSKEVPIVGTVIDNLVDSLSSAFKKAATFAGLGLIFIGMAAALTVITGAILKFSKMDPAAALGGLFVMMTIFTMIGVLMKSITKDMTGGKGLGVAAALVGLGVAMLFLSSAMATLSNKGNFMGFLGVVMALMLTAQIIEKFADTFNGGVKMYGIGKGIFYLALAVAALGLASRLFKGSMEGWSALFEAITALWAVMGGMYAFIWAIEKLEPKNLENIGKAFKDFGTGIAALVVGLILLGTFSQVATKGIVPFAIALGAMAVAMLLFKALKVDETFEKISGSIMNFAKASLILAAAIPLLGIAFTVLGQVIWQHALEFITGAVLGIGVLAGLIAALGAVSAPAAGPILAVGGAILMIAAAIAIVVGVIRGNDALGVVGDLAELLGGALGGGLGGLIDILGGAGKALKDFGGIAKSVMGELSSDSMGEFKLKLKNLDFLSSQVRSDLATQLEALRTVDGSEFEIGVENVFTYIKSLKLDPVQEKELVGVTIQGIVDMAEEDYTVTVMNLRSVVGSLQMDQKAEEEFYKLVEQYINGGATSDYPVMVQNLLTEIENLEIPEQTKKLVKDQVEKGVLAKARYVVAMNNVHLILEEGEVDPEIIEKVENEISSYINDPGHKQTVETTIDNINALIAENAVNMTDDQKAKLYAQIGEAANAQTEYDTTISTIHVLIGEEAGEGVDVSAITTELDSLIAKLGEELAKGESGHPETVISSIHALLAENGITLDPAVETQLDTLITEAGQKKTKWDTTLTALQVALGEDGLGWSDDAITKLINYVKTLGSNSSFETVLNKVSLLVKKFKLPFASRASMYKSMSEEVNETAGLPITVETINLALNDESIPQKIRDQIKPKITEALSDEKNPLTADALYLTILDIVTQAAEGDESLISQVMSSLGLTYDAATDVVTANIKKMDITIDNSNLHTKEAKKYWHDKIEDLLSIKRGQGEEGVSLSVAVNDFILDVEGSTLDEMTKQSLIETAQQVLGVWEEAYDAEYAKLQEKIQRKQRLEGGGALAVDTKTGMYLYKNNPFSNMFTEFWKNKDPSKESDWQAFSDYFDDQLEQGRVTLEDARSAFGNMTQEEIDKFIDTITPQGFGSGSTGGLLKAAFYQLVDDMLSGASEERKYNFKNEGRLNLYGLLAESVEGGVSGNKTEADYTNAIKFINEYYAGLEQLITTDENGGRKHLEEIIRDHYGYSDNTELKLSDIYKYFFPEEELSQEEEEFRSLIRSQLPDPIEQLLDIIEEQLSNGETLEGIDEATKPWHAEITTGFKNMSAEAAEAAYNSLDEGKQEIIKKMQEVFNPDNIEDLPSYYKWLGEVLDEFSFKDENGQTVNLMQQMLESGVQDLENFDPGKYLLEALLRAPEEGTHATQVNIADFLRFNPEFTAKYENYLPPEMAEEIAKQIQEDAANAVEEQAENLEGADASTLVSKLFSGDGVGEAAKEEIKTQLENNELSEDELYSAISGNATLGGFASWFTSQNKGGTSEDFYTAIVDSLKTGDSSIFETLLEDKGGNIWTGLKNGLFENKDIAENEIGSDALSLIQRFCSVLGIGSPSRVMHTQGSWMMIGLKQGIKANKSGPIDAVKDVAKACVNAIKDYITQFNTQGAAAGTAFGTGIGSKQFWAKVAGMGLATQAKEGAASMDGAMERAGENFADGFIRGIGAKVHEAYQAGVALGMAAAQGEADATKTESPSKVAMQLGRYFGEGYVIGLGQFSKQAGKAGGDLAESAIDSFGNPLSTIQSLLDSDMDLDPTIRPVMDLSDIQNGVRTINGMMPDTKMGLNFISSSMSKVKTTNTDVVNAITGLSKQLSEMPSGDTYTVNGITYDDGSNITSAIRSLVHEAKIERRR